MAVRFYLTNTAEAFNPNVFNTFFTDTTLTTNRFELSTTKSGTASTLSRAETSTNPDTEVLLGRWISAPFLRDGDWPAIPTSPALNICCGVRESSTSANMYMSYTIAIAKSDGTLRGTETVGSYLGSVEFPTTATGRQVGGNSSRAVSGCQAGDRLVVELGFYANNSVSTSFTGTINYGGTGATDLTDGSTSVTTRPGWVDILDDSVADFWVAPPATQTGRYFHMPGLP